jgi:hypothetical protein
MQSSSSFHSFHLFFHSSIALVTGLSRTNTMPKQESRCKSRCTEFFHFIPSICSFYSSIGFVDSSVRTSPPPFFCLLLPRLKPFSSSESNRTREYAEYSSKIAKPVFGESFINFYWFHSSCLFFAHPSSIQFRPFAFVRFHPLVPLVVPIIAFVPFVPAHRFIITTKCVQSINLTVNKQGRA